MLDTFRNSAKGTAGKIIVGLIVITFVLFGAESIISIAGNSAPATVNGEDLSELDYQRLLSSRQQELTNQFGAEVAAQLANSPFLQEEIIESLISQKIQSQISNSLSFDVSEEQVLKTFSDVAAFQIDGEFDQNQYQNILAANGFNHQSFVAAQRAQTALSQLQAGVANSAFVVEKIAQRYAALDAQVRTIKYRSFNSVDFESDVVLTEEELNAYYAENESQYLSEEQIKVDYVLVSLDDLAAELVVTDAELESAYQSYLAQLTESETREISHILFSDDDSAANAEAALLRLENGESFADLAIELSDDPGSAEFGGSLGELIPDVYVQEFYDAAIALKGEGDVSGLVTTQYGTHLIRLDALVAKTPDTLESKQAKLTAEIKSRKARDEMLLVESQLSDATFSTDSLLEVADTFQTTVIESDWITRSGGASVFSEGSVIQAAFSAQVVEDNLISDVVRLGNGDLIAMQKKEYAPEAVQPFASVEDQVVTALTSEKATELMKAELEASIAQKDTAGEEWSLVEKLGRNSTEVPTEVVTKAFEMAAGNASEPVLAMTDGEDTAYLVAVFEAVDVDADDEQLVSAQAFADRLTGGVQYQVLYNQARESADVKIRR